MGLKEKEIGSKGFRAGHDISLAAENGGRGLFHIDEFVKPELAARIGIVTPAAASEEASMWQRPSNIPPGSIK